MICMLIESLWCQSPEQSAGGDGENGAETNAIGWELGAGPGGRVGGDRGQTLVMFERWSSRFPKGGENGRGWRGRRTWGA